MTCHIDLVRTLFRESKIGKFIVQGQKIFSQEYAHKTPFCLIPWWSMDHAFSAQGYWVNCTALFYPHDDNDEVDEDEDDGKSDHAQHNQSIRVVLGVNHVSVNTKLLLWLPPHLAAGCRKYPF